MEQLRTLPAGEFPIEAVSHATLEYQRRAASARGELRPQGKAALAQATQVDVVKQAALQIEREQIRKAFDQDLISRETARSMRDNVAAIEYDLGG